MPEKILRLGLTESSLLFVYWMSQQNTDEELLSFKNNFIKWLYTTSGYYDKTQPGNYFDVVHMKDPPVYKKYMDTILEFIKNADTYEFMIHDYSNNSSIEDFKKLLNPIKMMHISQKVVFNFVENKKILIVSPFAKLIKSQIDSGNLKKIFPDSPTIVNNYIYTFPYTFFNNGPHENILETSEHLFQDIMETVKEEYDSVLISCGAYTCLLAKQFYDKGKNVCSVGGSLVTYFGILNERQKKWDEKSNKEYPHKEYWITTIPDEYKPPDYMKIEGGCYW